MAKPQLVVNTNQTRIKQYDDALVNSLIQSSSPIDYKKIETTLATDFPDQPILEAKFNIAPQVESLSPVEQDYFIRLKLMEWKVDQLQKQVSQISSVPSESLIFKIWFWLYSILIWVGSIVGGRFLILFTDKLIDKYWVNKIN